MSSLAGSPGDLLFRRLQNLAAREVRADLREVARALRHKDASVRWAAASALGKARVGERELLGQLKQERTGFVICELADSLSILESRRSLPVLKQAASRTRSPLARAYCYLAISEIAGAEELDFLRQARRRARHPWTRASLDCALFALGGDDALEGILTGLKEGPSEIRNWIAKRLLEGRPRRKRSVIAAALREALPSEEDPEARRALEEAVAVLGRLPRFGRLGAT